MIDEPISTDQPTDQPTGQPTRFGEYTRPHVADLLSAIGLDIIYERAEGDRLFYRDGTGAEIEVLDLLGGFGAGLFGHNHPELVAVAQAVLGEKRPFLAQGSVRAAAGELAARLSEMVGETTGQRYITTLANSGAEAVEAALKHAALQQTEAADGLLASNAVAFKRLRVGVKNGTLDISDRLYQAAAQLLETDQKIEGLAQLEFCLNRYNEAILQRPPLFLALAQAFHGKTSGAVQLTYNPEFRLPWRNLGLQSVFTPANDAEELEKTVAAERKETIHLVVDRNDIRLESRPWSGFTAILIEPIQGEGGIHELTADFLRHMRSVADCEQIPLIIDEIQSGMGRTGDFLASAVIRGDIYVFSKSLGGSLAKIGAMLVEKGRYIRPFGYLHTSTFADDAFSCEIALASLDLLQRDRYALMKRCREQGDYLRERLEHVQGQYPRLVKAVRGRGLMLGIELAELNHRNRSLLMNIASEQNLLGFLLCGYLLHEHQIRITPTISATNTIRIEPSATISYEAIDRFAQALIEGLALIEAGNAGDFLRYLSQSDQPAGEPAALSDRDAPEGLRRVAIVSHFVEPDHLTHFDPSLGDLSAVACNRLLERVQPVLKPFVVDNRVVQGASGDEVALTVIGIPYTAEQIAESIRRGTTGPVLAAIEQAVEMAKRLGCLHVGLTGHCSIVTRNCTALVEDEIGLTSGNSLTAAVASEGLHQALQERGILPEQTTLGIVGGIGNIGRVLALIEADYAGQILLVGRRGRRRLQKLADEIYALAWRQIQQGGVLTGVAKRLVAQPGFDVTAVPTFQTMADLFGDGAPVKVSLDLADLRRCNGIVSATNAPRPIITAAHVGQDRPVVICDVAVPNDVDEAICLDRPDVRVIQGGILQLPNSQTLDVRGLVLPHGQAYACVTETLLLGLAGIDESFSYGALRPERVRQIGRLAARFGFRVLARA